MCASVGGVCVVGGGVGGVCQRRNRNHAKFYIFYSENHCT